MKKLSLKVQGMKCGGCATKIKTALESVGAQQTQVDLENKTVTLEMPEDTRALDFKKSIESLGGFQVLSFEMGKES